ncbi:MAG: Crp/Fnr family transcriptional regulator [Chloroflexota bacterium]
MVIKLAQLSFFDGMSDAQYEVLAPYFARQRYKEGTMVFEQGDFAEYLYLVVEGEVVIRFKPDDGPEMTVTRVQPGGVFGWSAAMGNSRYTSGAGCVTDCAVVRIRGKDLRELCDKHPDIGRFVLDRLGQVIAERKHSQSQVTALLAHGIRGLASNGDCNDE